MNKNLFRIIFNKRRGQLMAVAETSSSQGTAASGDAAPLGRAVNTAALATLSFAVLCALGAVLWALPAPQAHAQVVAYRQAPGNQQPTILQTANGVPQVNIQTPSAAGVSRNVYSQFDVQNNGVILNNSRTSTATQLGGWVQGNPWLARGSARVILNEVNSSNPSYLNGYVEVAGQKAEVVIANPSGISVNGGGFINASKTTLTTGTPVLSGGNLDGYRVQGGSITVNGHGLDLSSTDYAAILARAVQVNAGVWANELKVVTGANQIDASSLGANTTPVTTAIAGTGAVPSFALDVAQIGGMYAGKIHLIGTEHGLGVRSAGTVGSTGGDFVLQNNGWLMNTGTLQAKGDLHISIQGDINTGGTLYASNNQVTDATGTVTNSHQIQAGNILSLSAGHIDNVVTGEMLATTNQLKATHTLTNRGLIDGADTQVDGGIVNNIGTGRIYGDHLSIAAATLINDTETVNGVTSAATLAARDRLDLGISDTFTNREHALIYSGTDMAIGGALDSNRQATGQADTVNNNSATIEAGGNLTIASAALNNRNIHLTTELEVKSIEPVVEYQGSGSANRYLAGTTGVYTFTDESLHLHTPEGNHEAWSSYDVTRTISETTIKTSDPSKILAGGNISLFGDSVYNDNSHIIAGNALNANVRTLNNTQLIGDHVVHDTGTATSYWRNRQKGTDSTGSSSATYNPADVVTSINLTVTRYLPNTTPVGTGTQMTALNNSSLYKTNPASNLRYLLETDPRFTNQKQWLGSDYITQYLPLDPNVTQKRLGDGFYEQRLIREQVAQLTGRRFLAYYTSDEQEYKALMTSAITFGQTYNLRTGIALTPQQMAQLTSDIVWLVEQTVTLADGSVQKALVPQLYLKPQVGDLQNSGTLLAGQDINLNLSGDLTNSGTIAGRNVVSLTAENVNNLGGLVQGSEMQLAALQDLNNEGGSISAVNSLSASAGRDLNVQTTTRSAANAQSSHTVVDRVAGLYVSGPNGTLVASAGRDLNIVAGVVSNAGSGNSTLEAGNNVNLSTVKTGQSHNIVWDAQNYRKDSASADVGSTVQAGGNLTLKAGQTVSATAADVQAKEALNVQATNIQLQAGQATQNVDEAHQHTSKGFLSKTTTTTRDTSNSTTALGSNLGGNTVNLSASNDIDIKGSNVVGDGNTTLVAGNNIRVEAAQNSSSSSSYRSETKSGLMGSGGLGVSYGKQKQSLGQQSSSTTAVGSTVGSVEGDVNITAGKQYKQVGSDVLAPQGDISIQAKTVDIQEARETSKQSVEQKFEQSGISIGLKGGIIDSIQATTQAVQAAKDSNNSRNQKLNALIAFGKGADAYEQGKATQDAYDKNGVMGGTDADGKAQPGAAAASGIKVSISFGRSSSQSNSTTTSNTSANSTVKAGGTVDIKATGQAEGEGDLTIQGSNVSAAKDVSLSAAKDVNILASVDTESNRSINKSSSTSVGVSVGIGQGGAGLSLDIAASRGKGQANSDSTTYNNSHVSAGNTVDITSGADTNVIGGNVSGQQVTANVGGNLNVESLQDTASSQASQKTTGIALSIPILGTGGSASLSQSKQNSNSNYASVNEQSGIKAGEGGFVINVDGNTDLKGATIVGSSDANKNTLTTNTPTTSYIKNSMSASASSGGTSVGTNMLDGKYAMAKALAGNALNNGSANQSDASTTTSAISAAQVTVGNKTTDTSKEQLKDSNGKAVSTDTSNTNRTLAKADVASLQKSAQEQQASNMLLVNAMTVVGDKIYRKETEQKRLDRIQCESANKENCSRQENVTLDQVKAVNGKITAINNGMLNTEDQTAIVAYMQSTGMQLQDGVLVVVNPKINDVLSEAAWVAWKKVEQVFGFGTSSAGELNLALQTIAAAQGAKLDTNSHSAGNFAVDEMLRKVQESGTINAAIGTVTMFGSPVNAQDTSDKVNAVTGGQGVTQQATHVNDFVSRWFSFSLTQGASNPATGGNSNTGSLDAHSSYTAELTTSDKNTPQLPEVKDLPSPKFLKDAANDSWGYSRPMVVPPRVKSTQDGEAK